MNAVETSVADDGWAALGDLQALAEEAFAAARAEIPAPRDGRVCVLFASDAGIAELNATHRGKSGPTNVLSFPAHASAAGWLGDIALALGVCRAEAEARGISLRDHARHLLAHGFLHLQGYDHRHEDEAEAMESAERRALARLGVADPYAIAERAG
ncbi:MAG: rRNA maturation RNase YbeY [Maricaulaceae bacterium]|nr:rRNA maturation RNase YbeY [Maricaulaceae bacterium]